MTEFKTPDNADRADWARQALDTFKAVTGSDDDSAIADLIADLCHLAVEMKQDPLTEISRGIRMYMDERDYPPDGWCPIGEWANARIDTWRGDMSSPLNR